MTISALITMLTAWAIIAYYTIKFFVKVLRHSPGGDSDSYGDNDANKKP